MNKDMKVAIITGATGDIGKAVVAEAIALGYYVLAFGRDISKLSEIKEKFTESVSTFSVDLSDEQKIREILGDVSMMFPHIDLVVGAAGTFKWDDEFPGENLDEQTNNAVAFLSEVNFESKVRFDKILHEIYGDKISPVVKLVGSHIADPNKFSEKDIKDFKEVGYATSMKNVRRFVEIKQSDTSETWTYKIIEPGLIDTEMARRAFTRERIGRDVDWQMEAMSPEFFAKEFFLDILGEIKKAA